MSDEKSNTGNRNTGNRNTGYWNTGDWNTGYSNTGNSNTGYWNTGNSNTGYWNTGNSNTGNWNTGNSNTGFFCEETPRPTFFDLPCDLSWEDARDAIPHVELCVGAKWTGSIDMTDQEKADHPEHETIGGFLEAVEMPLNEAFPLAWEKMDEADRERWKGLPNFDAAKFKNITGVDVNSAAAPTVKIRTPDGQVVELLGEVVSQ